MPNTAITFLLDNFMETRPGEPYRWLPFGTIKKGNATREVTPELAHQFKLPHFKPPIKVGSHEETTPAGGHIVAFEVRADGIWVTPEYVASGEKALAEGAYRYHSPEVIWEDGYIQNPTTGELIPGPFIMGDALLHTPHLGEAAALYHIEIRSKDMDAVDKLASTLTDFFGKFNPAPVTEPQKPADYDALKAQAADAEKYKAEATTKQAEIDRLQAEGALKARIEKYDTAVAETKAPREGMGALLAALPDATAEKVVQVFKALSEQIKESDLTAKRGKVGTDATGATPVEVFHAAVVEKSIALKSDYNTALEAVKVETPALYQAYVEALSRKEK